MNRYIKKAVIVFIWVCIWQVTAVIVNNPIYFASPLETLAELAGKIQTASFWQSVGGSLGRILTGFVSAFALAFVTAFVTVKYTWLGDFLSPFVTFIKSVPIAAVVVILLIWWGPKYLVLCISMMVVFPNIYANMRTGLMNADRGLLEMAKVFDIRPWDKLLWIYRPSYIPYLHSAVSVSLGICFKSGIAAEVIGLPEFAMGERLYRDKIYLNTAGVFAWIIVVLALSALTERLIVSALKLLAGVPAPCLRESRVQNDTVTGKDAGGYTVYSDGVTKSYEGRTIIDTALKFEKGSVYYLKEPSGAGKTTLLKMIAGLIRPDSGSVDAGKITMVFQDDRLVESANALRNLKLAGCTGDLIRELSLLLPQRTMELPASDLSGGERRRLAVARAVLHPSDIVIMDEPFAGLDADTRNNTIEWINSRLGGRTLLFTSHEAESVSFADTKVIRLRSNKE